MDRFMLDKIGHNGQFLYKNQIENQEEIKEKARR